MSSKRAPVERWTEPVDWDTLPDFLTIPEVCPILRCGRRDAYRWARKHPGLVVELGGIGKRVSRTALRRFCDRDPEMLALAVLDPYAKAQPVSPALLRLA